MQFRSHAVSFEMAASVCSDCLESDRIHEMDRKDWQGTLARPGMQGVQDVKEIRPAGQAGKSGRTV